MNKKNFRFNSMICSWTRSGVGNPWHANTFYPAHASEASETRSFLFQMKNNNNLQVAASLDEGLEIPSLLIMFLLTIRQLSQKLMHISFN